MAQYCMGQEGSRGQEVVSCPAQGLQQIQSAAVTGCNSSLEAPLAVERGSHGSMADSELQAERVNTSLRPGQYPLPAAQLRPAAKPLQRLALHFGQAVRLQEDGRGNVSVASSFRCVAVQSGLKLMAVTGRKHSTNCGYLRTGMVDGPSGPGSSVAACPPGRRPAALPRLPTFAGMLPVRSMMQWRPRRSAGLRLKISCRPGERPKSVQAACKCSPRQGPRTFAAPGRGRGSQQIGLLARAATQEACLHMLARPGCLPIGDAVQAVPKFETFTCMGGRAQHRTQAGPARQHTLALVWLMRWWRHRSSSMRVAADTRQVRGGGRTVSATCTSAQCQVAGREGGGG